MRSLSVAATGMLIAFGVLTCQNPEQARARAGPPGAGRVNKGAEAMAAAIETANALKRLRAGARPARFLDRANQEPGGG